MDAMPPGRTFRSKEHEHHSQVVLQQQLPHPPCCNPGMEPQFHRPTQPGDSPRDCRCCYTGLQGSVVFRAADISDQNTYPSVCFEHKFAVENIVNDALFYVSDST